MEDHRQRGLGGSAERRGTLLVREQHMQSRGQGGHRAWEELRGEAECSVRGQLYPSSWRFEALAENLVSLLEATGNTP